MACRMRAGALGPGRTGRRHPRRRWRVAVPLIGNHHRRPERRRDRQRTDFRESHTRTSGG